MTPDRPTFPTRPIRPADRDVVLTSLRAGVVPRRGLQHLQVGREAEITALTGDLDRVGDGGSAVRFLIADYGAGKTFTLTVIGSAALHHKFVTVHADLNPDRRLHGSDGQARSLYAELMRNLATAGRPDGGALEAVVERFITTCHAASQAGSSTTSEVIAQQLTALTEMTGGFDFAHVIDRYWHGHDTGDDQLKAAAVRWLRAEYSTKSQARTELGVRTIIDDHSFYDSLKLLARFVRLAGFTGLLVTFDECVNLYKLANTASRNANYEQILRIVNDCLQGSVVGLGVYFAGTPEFLTDTRRGLFSYDALRSRLAENTFATGGLTDHSGPVLRLNNLTQEELYVLLRKLRHLQAGGDPNAYLLPDEALEAFMQHCRNRVGDAYFRTPRTTIRGFLDLLAVLEHNRDTRWQSLLTGVRLPPESNPDLAQLSNEPDGTDARSTDAPAGGVLEGSATTEAAVDDDLVTLRLTVPTP